MTHPITLQTGLKSAERYLKVFFLTSHYLGKARAAQRSHGGLSAGKRHELTTAWARETLEVARVNLIQKGSHPAKSPAIFVGNHIGYLDIPVLMSAAPVVFVAKKELSYWPIFGSAMKTVGTVLVSRRSKHSRAGAAVAIARAVLDRHQSVAIFPSGTTTIDENKEWRRGAFQIAKQYGIPIQPFRLRFHPVKKVAFIGEDSFIPHLWNLLQLPKIEATIEFHEPVLVEDAEADCRKWWNWAREGMN